MKHLYQTVVQLCIFASLISSIGCGETQQSETSATAETSVSAVSVPSETEELLKETSFFKIVPDDLPDTLDFQNRIVTILSRNFERCRGELFVSEQTGDVVDDAVFQREHTVEDRLNCQIEHRIEGEEGDLHGGKVANLVKQSVLSGEKVYDIVANSNYGTTTQFPSGLFLNLKDVGNLNFEKDYWANYVNSNAELFGNLYGATGSISLFLYQQMFAVYFNRELCGQYGFPADMVYQMVFDGKWTIDKMISMTKDIYKDLDGDGEADEDDLYGFGLQVSSSTDGYWSSCRIQMTERTDDGGFALKVNGEKLINVVEKLTDFAYNQPGVIRLVVKPEFPRGHYLPDAFANDQFLFMNDWIYSAGSDIFRDMKSDYGIIPYPKYDEQQDDYYSYIHDAFTIFCIPTTAENPDEIGAVLEAMASEGHNIVLPAYYEKALTAKYARDTDSVTSLQTIFRNAYLDTGWIYSPNLNGFPQYILRDMVWNNKDGVASRLEKKSKATEKVITKMLDKFENLF